MFFGSSLIQKKPTGPSFNKIIEETQETGALFLGDFKTAKNVEFLKENSIKSVLSLMVDYEINYKDFLSNHKVISAQDKDTFDLSKHFDECFEFIDEALKKGSVLIHCVSGISRSSAILIMYLMKKSNKKYLEAYTQVKKKRCRINPNKGFIKQLQNFESSLVLSN